MAKSTKTRGRLKPMVPKAGFTKTPNRRYGKGGKLK